jgi:hypothetical protein
MTRQCMVCALLALAPPTKYLLSSGNSFPVRGHNLPLALGRLPGCQAKQESGVPGLALTALDLWLRLKSSAQKHDTNFDSLASSERE